MTTRIVITGTSGVGKTYLESLLHNDYGFIQLPKHTNRPQRPGEVEGRGIFFVEKSELINSNNKYFFSLDYSGYTYSWKNSDLEANILNNVTMAITLESLSGLLDTNQGFIPIILYIDKNNIDLLIERIKLQLDYYNLNDVEKDEADKIIEKRINLAKEESTKIDKYLVNITTQNKGKAFKIIDDLTIPDEVVPYILSLM
jgi:guanylate kinase